MVFIRTCFILFVLGDYWNQTSNLTHATTELCPSTQNMLHIKKYALGPGSTEVKVLAPHVADLSSISSTTYGPLSNTRSDP